MAPKYWKESITPEANPAIFRPPKSNAAAVPMIECVELHVSEIIVNKTHADSGPASLVWLRMKTLNRIESVSSQYSSTATGARFPRNNVSEISPEENDPT